MYTISKNTTFEMIINKSKFVTKIYKVDSVLDVKTIIDSLKVEFNDATHICYSYVISNNKYAFDDGEPNGTAGLPILGVLEKKNMDLVLCVVIRYFGGIKLGSGGLIRAYKNSAIKCLEISEIIVIKYGYLVKIYFLYNNTTNIDYLLKDVLILKKDFNEKVFYEIVIDKDYFDKIKNNFDSYKIVKDVLM